MADVGKIIWYAINTACAFGVLAWNLQQFRQAYLHRSVFPYSGRMWFYCMFSYILTLAILSAFVLLLVFAPFAAEGKSCVSFICVLYAFVTCTATPLSCLAAFARAFALLHRHKIQNIVVALKEYNQTGTLPKGVAKQEDILNSWWFRKRHYLKPDFVRKVAVGASIVTVLVVITLLTIGLFDGSFLKEPFLHLVWTITRLFAFVLFVLAGFIAFELSDMINDNFGILSELKHAALTIIAYLVVFVLGVVIGGENFTGYYGDIVSFNLTFVVLTYIAFYVPNKKIHEEDRLLIKNGTTQSQASASMSSVETLFSTTSPQIRMSVLQSGILKTEKVTKKDFHGFITSKEGFNAFSTFLLKEFATENLAFWRNSRDFSVIMKRSLVVAQQAESKKTSYLGATATSTVAASANNTDDGDDVIGDLVSTIEKSHHTEQIPGVLERGSMSTSATDKEGGGVKAHHRRDASRSVLRSTDEKSRTGSVSVMGAKTAGGRLTVTAADDISESLSRPFWEQARDLYDSFISADSMYQVNLNSKTTNEIEACILDLQAEVDETPAAGTLFWNSPSAVLNEHSVFITDLAHTFKLAEKEIFKLMKTDSWRRFIHAKEYQDLVKDIPDDGPDKV